ncbi:phage tail tape measure protein [Staphylococcus pseudintermedius]|nr:phage tail tape measure protein [Staphylococcus pseudintermedius]EIK0270391.1 phage tail tape measure protein [Staphylococcus pseudintermedius]EJD8504359.1 phage tail tape measure protein [Staphylococcus pseudintermedius]EJL1760805.1 phage tail tape measure protein [Staphylococcus pseudintermedius]
MASPIGNMVIRVDLDGAGFNKGIAGLNRQMRMVSREMSANLSQFGRYDKSLEKSRLKVDGLTKRQQLQTQKVKELKAQYNRLSAETGENSAKTQAAASKYNEAYAKLNLYEKELAEATNEMKRMEQQQRVLNTSMGKIGAKLTQWGPKFQEIGRSMQSVGRSMSLYVTAPVVAGFGAAVKKSIDFDDSMRKVKATSGATSGEFQQLRDKALEMGAKTKFSASQSAEALNYMALAGWDTKEMMSGIDGVMQLAAASGEDLGAVSDIVTDSLTAFGLKAKDSGHFADVLAQTSSKANTDVRGMGEAFKYAAPVAGALGYTVEDTSIAIGLMSNAGIKGEKAGTALRTMFTNLAKPTKAMKNQMDELGISITDSQGNMLPMRDVMDQLRGKFKGLSKDQQASAAATIFGKEAMSGALAVINASDEDYKKLTKSIDNSAGASKRMADEMEGGIGGSIRRMKSSIESLAISIGDVLAPYIKKLAEFIADAAAKLNEMPKGTQKVVVGLGLIAAAIGPLLVTLGVMVSTIGASFKVLGPLFKGIGKLTLLTRGANGQLKLFTLTQKIWNGVVSASKAIADGYRYAIARLSTSQTIATLKTKLSTAATKIWTATTKAAALATRGLGLAIRFMAGPIGIVITAVGLLVGGIIHLWRTNETFRNAVIKIWNSIKNSVLSLARGIWDGLKFIFNSSWFFIRTVFTTIKIFMTRTWIAIKNSVLNIVRNLLNGIKAVFTKLSSWTRSLFNSVYTFMRNVWTNIRNVVVRIASSLWNGVRNVWNRLFTGTRNIFSKVKTWLVSLWTSLKNRVVSIGSNMWANLKRIFNNLFNGSRSIFNRVKSFMVNIWQSIRRSVTGIASSLWNTVRRTFNNMANGLKSIIGRIKSHIGGMVSAIKRGLNGLIKGLNWVGSKLSLPKIPTLSTGTQRINRHVKTTHDGRLKEGTMAVVGDKGPGNGRGIDGRRELIQYPNGRTALTPAKDTTTWLPRGSRVISGSMRQKYEEAEGAGMYPRFSVGTWFGKSTNWIADKAGAIGSAIKNSASWLTDKIGDVMDFMDSPGKLFNKVMSLLGVDFGSLTKGMGIVGQIARAAFAKIKKGAIDWIKGGFDAQAGDGSVFDGFRILQPYSAPPKAPNPNYPFNGGVHHGVDYDTPVGTPIRTPMGGRVRSWYDNYGGGKAITVQKGRTFLWFMHLSEQLRRTGEQIKAGQLIGKSGNTGSMTNYRHLHFQVNQGGEANRYSTDPIPWLKKNDKTGGGKRGHYPKGSGAAYASRVISQAQRILGGSYNTRYVHDQMMRLVKRESNYQPDAVNNWDINAQRGTPSRGLFQMIKPTFDYYAKPGYTNFNNPLHQALSSMRNIARKYGGIYGFNGAFKRAADYAYATGGKVYNGLYHLGEEDYPEWIIPTNPSRASDAAKLLALASKDISKNKRPKNFNTSAIGNDTNGNSKLESKLDTMIGLLIKLVGSNEEIADKDYTPIIDNFGLKDFINATIDKRERDKSRKGRYGGGALI